MEIIEWWGLAICVVLWHVSKALAPVLTVYLEYLLSKKNK